MSRIVLIGASQRALIPSVIASGNVPVCLDLFTDWDSRLLLKRHTSPIPNQISQLSSFESLLDLPLARLGDVAIVGGGCELHPKIVAHIERQIPIAGSSPESLEIFQDTLSVLHEVEMAGFSVPRSHRNLGSISGTVLSKPMAGCGGNAIRLHEPLKHKAAPDPTHPNSVEKATRSNPAIYYQEKIQGLSFSGLVATTDCGQSTLLGITRQLVGSTWLNAPPFCYCGSVGPMPVETLLRFGLSTESIASIRSAAKWIAKRFELKGIWGFDFLVGNNACSDASKPNYWIVDINPRIPASAELYESKLANDAFQKTKSIVDLHLQCCLNGSRSAPQFLSGGSEDRFPKVEAKAILFWPQTGSREQQSLVINEPIFESLRQQFDPHFFLSNNDGNSIADVPQPQTVIQPGHPVLTLRSRSSHYDSSQASGDWIDDAERWLQKKAADLYRLLY